MSTPLRQIVSINVARVTSVQIKDRRVATAIGKRTVSTLTDPRRIVVNPLGLEGDEQSDLSVHGGLSRAVYAYPFEHYPFWQTVRAQAQAALWDEPIPHGLLGENLTLTGLMESDAYIGDVLRFPDCALAVSEPRYPCFKFEAVMGFKHAPKMMAQSGFSGVYLSVRQPGSLAAGEHYDIEPGPREVSIRELFMTKMKQPKG